MLMPAMFLRHSLPLCPDIDPRRYSLLPESCDPERESGAEDYALSAELRGARCQGSSKNSTGRGL